MLTSVVTIYVLEVKHVCEAMYYLFKGQAPHSCPVHPVGAGLFKQEKEVEQERED